MPDGRSMVNLDLERAAAAAEVHERHRALRIELPIDQPDQRLHDVEDDAAAAGRAERRPRLARFVEDDGWSHRAARPLARSHGVGERPAGAVDGAEGEIRELVV